MSWRSGESVTVAVVSKVPDTDHWAFGKRFLGHLIDTDQRLAPQRLGYWEPLKTVFDGIDSAYPIWDSDGFHGRRGTEPPAGRDWPVMWDRRRVVASSGLFHHAGETRYGNPLWADCHFDAGPRDDVDWLRLFRGWCALMPPVLASIHHMDRQERSVKDPPYDLVKDGKTDPWKSSQAWFKFRAGASQKCLEKNGYIPNLWWGTVFGPEHAADVDWDGIAAAGFAVEDLGGGKFVRVTDDLFDVGENWPHFSAERARLKALFPKGKFKIEDEPDIDPDILDTET